MFEIFYVVILTNLSFAILMIGKLNLRELGFMLVLVFLNFRIISRFRVISQGFILVLVIMGQMPMIFLDHTKSQI